MGESPTESSSQIAVRMRKDLCLQPTEGQGDGHSCFHLPEGLAIARGSDPSQTSAHLTVKCPEKLCTVSVRRAAISGYPM